MSLIISAQHKTLVPDCANDEYVSFNLYNSSVLNSIFSKFEFRANFVLVKIISGAPSMYSLSLNLPFENLFFELNGVRKAFDLFLLIEKNVRIARSVALTMPVPQATSAQVNISL